MERDADELLPVAGALAPVEKGSLKVSRARRVAAGVGAVWSSLRQVLAGPGLVRGVRALRTLNQMGGVDCPSCAWPDPDRERSHVRVLRERGEGRRVGSGHAAAHARVLSHSVHRRHSPSSPITGTGNRAGSPSRWCCGREPSLRTDRVGRRRFASSPTN